jgi:fibronectin-binding autotransporter adhesin
VLTFQGSQSLSGSGTLTFANVTGAGGLAVPSGSALTIAAGITAQGSSGTIGSSGLLMNEGTIEATGGGTLTVQGDTNFSGDTLSGGTWGAVGDSTLRLVGANVTTSAAGILLDGASAQIDDAATGTTSALAGAVDQSAVLLGRVVHTGDLASQGQYSGTLSAPVPGLPAGSYYVIVVVDSGLQVPDINRANGTGAAPTELSTKAA